MKANKNQILIAHQKEDIDRTQKSKASRQKKVQLGFRGFCPYYLLLNTPYIMFESKQNSNSNCSSEGICRSNPKKYSKPPKKVQLGFRGFCPYFLLLTTPYVMFESKQNSNSNCSSEGRYRLKPKKYS